jgi:hypothetical protein
MTNPATRVPLLLLLAGAGCTEGKPDAPGDATGPSTDFDGDDSSDGRDSSTEYTDGRDSGRPPDGSGASLTPDWRKDGLYRLRPADPTARRAG